eukprot:12374956-Alexandrium_andersonii.AAC.1
MRVGEQHLQMNRLPEWCAPRVFTHEKSLDGHPLTVCSQVNRLPESCAPRVFTNESPPLHMNGSSLQPAVVQ